MSVWERPDRGPCCEEDICAARAAEQGASIPKRRRSELDKLADAAPQVDKRDAHQRRRADALQGERRMSWRRAFSAALSAALCSDLSASSCLSADSFWLSWRSIPFCCWLSVLASC